MNAVINLARAIADLFTPVPDFVTTAQLTAALGVERADHQTMAHVREWMRLQGWRPTVQRVDGISVRGYAKPAAPSDAAFKLTQRIGTLRSTLDAIHRAYDDDELRVRAADALREDDAAALSQAAQPAGQEQAGAVAWRDMATAPKDGTLLRLLVEFEHHATEDGEGPQPTVGSNTWDNHHDFDEWQFAGWNWEQDCYTQGIGKPVGWLPMLEAAPGAAIAAREQEATGSATNGDALALLRRSEYFVSAYAARNPKWDWAGTMQDPSGVHALLAEIRATLKTSHTTAQPQSAAKDASLCVERPECAITKDGARLKWLIDALSCEALIEVGIFPFVMSTDSDWRVLVDDAMQAHAKRSQEGTRATMTSKALKAVISERLRQQSDEGWTPEHDDGHVNDEIAAMAAYYAMPVGVRDWPATETGYGATFGEAIRPEGWQAKESDRWDELVKAGALVLAELERLERADAVSTGGAA